MCENPKYIPGNPSRVVPCQKCGECVQQRRMSFIGRAIAETRFARRALFATLTFGGGDENHNAVVFNYRLVQNYLKSLRKAGCPVRYHCIGELGTERGRVHFHLLLWFQEDKTPPWRLDWSCKQKFWDHGFSEYTECNTGWIAYIAGYISEGTSAVSKRRKKTKRAEDRVISHGSKNPLVGGPFFDMLAWRHVQAGIAPRDNSYSFGESLRTDGTKFDYWMGPTAKEYYCRRYLVWWRAYHGDAHPPSSYLIDDYLDDEARRRVKNPATAEEIDAECARILGDARKNLRVRVPVPEVCPRTGRIYQATDTRAPVEYDQALLVWRYPAIAEEGVSPLYWSFDNEGRPAWFPVIRGDDWARKRQAEIAQRIAASRRLRGIAYDHEVR